VIIVNRPTPNSPRLSIRFVANVTSGPVMEARRRGGTAVKPSGDFLSRYPCD
jgi:hypothetical protein